MHYETSTALDVLARHQHGLATRHQIIALTSEVELRRLRRRRGIERVHWSVYRFQGTPASWEHRMMAAVLSAPKGSCASHRAAGRLWQLSGCESAGPELTVPEPASTRGAGALSHRSRAKVQMDHEIQNIPVTKIERTIIDLSSVLHVGALARCIDDALSRQLTTVTDIADIAVAMGTKGRARTTVIDALLAERRASRFEVDSALHRRILRWLDDAGISGWVSEMTVRVGGKQRRLDIAWPDKRLAIEVDGFAFHRQRTSFDDDRRRNNWLLVNGWRVLHVTSATNKAELYTWLAGALHTNDDEGGAFAVDN